jgi:hypothetical protein
VPSLAVTIIGSVWTAAYRDSATNALPRRLSSNAAAEARDTLGGAVAAVEQVSSSIGTALIDAAHEAFVTGLQLTAAVSAAVAVATAVMATVFVRRVRADGEPTDRRNGMTLDELPSERVRGVRDAPRPTFLRAQAGLTEGVDQGDGSRIYTREGGTSLHVYPSAGSAGVTAGTVATSHVADLERVVTELVAAGVIFERYDQPDLQTDASGAHVMDDGKVAWFRDPDGNTFAI